MKTCEWPNCESLATDRNKLCGMHRMRKLNGTDMEAPRRGALGCMVNGCGGEYYANGYCGKHYARVRRGPQVHQDSLINVGRECLVDDCHRNAMALGYCSTHYARLHRGAPLEAELSARGRGPSVPSFRTAHNRVQKSKGSASGFACIDCGGPAKQWAYRGNAPDELLGVEGVGRGYRYSLDPSFYDAKCVKCHAAVDKKIAADELFEYRFWKHVTGLTLADFTPDPEKLT